MAALKHSQTGFLRTVSVTFTTSNVQAINAKEDIIERTRPISYHNALELKQTDR